MKTDILGDAFNLIYVKRVRIIIRSQRELSDD
jgi:hypothetical protein